MPLLRSRLTRFRAWEGNRRRGRRRSSRPPLATRLHFFLSLSTSVFVVQPKTTGQRCCSSHLDRSTTKKNGGTPSSAGVVDAAAGGCQSDPAAAHRVQTARGQPAAGALPRRRNNTAETHRSRRTSALTFPPPRSTRRHTPLPISRVWNPIFFAGGLLHSQSVFMAHAFITL